MELKPCPFCGGESEGISDKGVVYVRIIHKRECPLYEMIGAMPQRQWEAWNHRPTEDALRAEQDALREERGPTVVCLCGSTRFKQEFFEANFRETMAGKIVLSVGWFSHADGEIYTPTEDEKRALDELHKRKIDLSDEVLILDVGGYIGESTKSELEYAKQTGKRVRFRSLEALEGGK